MQLNDLIKFAQGNENFMKIYETHMNIREDCVCPLVSLCWDESNDKDDNLLSENETELEIQDTMYGQNLAKEIEKVLFLFVHILNLI